MKTLGILGGMGPFASLKFLEQVTISTPATKDWNHLRIIMDSNPHIPSRTRHYLYNEESPVQGMVDSCLKLQNYPVDVIVIPCNSACYFIDQLKEKVDIPIFNIIEITSNYIKEISSIGQERIAVFGGYITYKEETYKKFLEGRDYVFHSEEEQQFLSNIIEDIKLGKNISDIRNKFNDFLINYKFKYDPNIIVLGCTEFLCLNLEEEINEMNVVDSSKVLARHIVNYCKGSK